MSAPDLAYVALVVDEPDVSAAIFQSAFGLPREELPLGRDRVPVIGIGQSALAFFAPHDPFLGDTAKMGVHHVGIAADDPLQAVEAAGLAIAGPPGEGLCGNTQLELARQATCGVRVRFTQSLGLGSAASGMVERIDHLGVASIDNQAACAIFIDKLGCVYESQQTDSEVETLAENFTSDTYANVYHTRASRVVGSLRVTFITVGDTEFEFLQDLTGEVKADEAQHNAAGNTRGDRSAIARYIGSRGAGLHHLALKTPDINGSLARLNESGHRTIDSVGRPGSRAAQIGFMHPSMLGGVLMHFVEREEH